jgi:hypothetical protein
MVHVWKDEKDKPNIELTGEDRGRDILYGRRLDDLNHKVVRIGIKIPTSKHYLKIQSGKDVYEQEAHSPVMNYWKRYLGFVSGMNQDNNLFCLMKQNGLLSAINLGAPKFSYRGYGDCLSTINSGYVAAANLDTKSIVVGTGNTAWDINNFAPETLILQGTAAGKLVYGNVQIIPPSNVGGVWTGYTRRTFDNFNVDANIITIKEVCQLCPEWSSGAGSTFQFNYLDERTVLNTPKDIPYRSGVLFTYTKVIDVSGVTNLVRNGIQFLIQNSACTHPLGIISTSNTACPLVSGDYALVATDGDYSAGLGNDNFGGQVGSGNTPVSSLDYKLQTQILTVNGLTHGNTTKVASLVGNTFLVSQARTFTVGVGAKTIREIGITLQIYNDSAISQYCLMSRSVLAVPVVLAVGESLTTIYDFTLTYP